jgi:sugar/nucleoside kinase (ribokinase family)
MLCPIANEIDLGFLTVLENKLICACPQGWLRQWDSNGVVSKKNFEEWAMLTKADIICLSENDIGCDWRLAEEISKVQKTVAITQGKHGATIFHQGDRHFFPACQTIEVDPTGAGDIFAAAFTLMFFQSGGIEQAAAFAHAAASLNVEKVGIEGIPYYSEMKERQKFYSASR